MSQRYLYLYSGAISEALLGIHIGRTLAANVPGAVIEILSARPNTFIKELCVELPFARYKCLPKETLSGWAGLLELVQHPYISVVLKPVTVDLPLWWRLILWCARVRKGSIQASYQLLGHESRVPKGVRKLIYDCPTENYFDTPPRLLELWGIPAVVVPKPTLSLIAAKPAEPYMLFHFFAGSYKRSIPAERARAILSEARAAFPQHRFILTCMDSERERAAQMCAGMERVEINSSPSATRIIELLSGADLVVGTASGILTVASHLLRPVIAMSCLCDLCWLPTFSPETIILAARDECRCTSDKKTSVCVEHTPEGDVFRYLYFIKTEDVIAAMKQKYAK
jgi:hypothetical protein